MGGKQMKQQQGTPKGEGAVHLGKGISTSIKPYGKRWVRSGQDPRSNCVQSVVHIQNLSQARSCLWLRPKNCRLCFLFSPSHREVKRRESGGMTFGTDFWLFLQLMKITAKLECLQGAHMPIGTFKMHGDSLGGEKRREAGIPREGSRLLELKARNVETNWLKSSSFSTWVK